MLEIIQHVTTANKEAVLERYLAVGWCFMALYGQMSDLVALKLAWHSESPPVYPDLSDLFPENNR